MRTIGVVGGIGPESTIDYYRMIVAVTRERGLDGAPPVLINSIDVDRLLALAGADDKGALIEYLLRSVEALVVPGGDDQTYVHAKYVTELLQGTFTHDTRDGMCRVLDRLRARDAIDGVILGGTELPLLLRGVDYPVPLLDTAKIHVAAAVTQAAG